MTSLNIHLKEDEGSEKIPPLAGGCWLISVRLQPIEKFCSWDPLDCRSLFLWSLIHTSWEKRLLSDKRCKTAHATRMQVFLQANSSINPKQQALELVFCFWGTHASSPDSTPPTFSFQGVPQAGVCSALGLLDCTEHHTLPCFLQQSFWIIPALSVTVCMHACVWTKEVYLHLLK